MANGLAGLEIRGRVRTLSPVLFYQTNTRYLIMNNNQLKNLPAGQCSRGHRRRRHADRHVCHSLEIGNLVNLVLLDLSHNRLKTLPSQIGLFLLS